MSVSEPNSTAVFAAGIEIDPPDFPVVVRGYDRQRVNDYLQNVVARLAAEHDRAAKAEQAAANNQPPTFEHLGAEAIKVLELASGSAELLVAQAKRHGEAIVEEAEAQATDLFEEARQRAERLHAAARGTLTEAAGERDRILAEASEQATQIRTLAEDDARAMLEEAQAESQRMWQKVREECSAMQAQTERLQMLRDRTMEHLSRVQIEVNSLLVRPPDDELDVPSELEAAGSGDAAASLEATANTAPESGEPDAALAVQPESDQVGGSKPGRPAKASARDRSQSARSG